MCIDILDEFPECPDCASDLEYIDCQTCGGEGVDGHDCGEDCCCCLHPEDNVPCDICNGKGGWYWCGVCKAEKEPKFNTFIHDTDVANSEKGGVE